MEDEGETGEEEEVSEGPKPAKNKKGKKDKKKFDPLADTDVKFKKVDFEHALTPEEKAAKKKEKEDKKKGKGEHKKPKKAPESTAGENEEMGGGDTQEQKSEEQETDKTVEGEETELSEQKPQAKKKGGKKEKPQKETKEKDKKGNKEKVEAELPEKGKKKKDKEKPSGDKDEKDPHEGEEEEVEEEEEIEEEEEKIKIEKEKSVTDTTKKGKEKEKVKEEVPSKKKKGKEKDEDEEGKKQKGKKKLHSTKAAKTESKIESETVETKEEGAIPTGKGKKGKNKNKKGKKGRKSAVELVDIEEEETTAGKTEPVKKFPSDDEWSWYSCSCSEGDEEEQVEEEEVVTKKGKKGKKGKKAKKEKKKKPKKEEIEEQKKEEEPAAEDDIFAEIKKMQAAALGQPEEVVETVEKKAKPKKHKKEKKPKGPKKKVVMTEAMRKQMEEEAKRLAEEERIRAEEERKRLIAKEKKEQVDHILRMEQLENSILLKQQIIENNHQLFLIVKEESEWDHFIICDGLPYSINVAEMNTYIDLWNRYMKRTDIKIAIQRTKDVLKILDFLTEYIEMPLDASPGKIEDWKWIRRQCIENQQRNVDSLTCYILSYINERMHRISIPVAEYNLEQPDFTLCLYALVALPQPLVNPRRPPNKRLEIDFTAMKLRVVFPENLNCYLLAIRSMYLKYDHLTDTSRTFTEPELPDIFKKDLKETTFLEFYYKLYYKYINRIIPPSKPLEEGEEPTPEPEVDIEKGLVPTVPYQKLEPTASEYFLSIEDEAYADTIPSLTTVTAPKEVNLRKYSIIGGIFFLNLFHQPPQPKILPNLEIVVTVLKDPNCLKEYPFYVEYNPPPAPGPGVIRLPEEIEEEMKQQEQKMDKLIFVNMDLPMHVLWLDPPIVCRWNYKEKLWTTEDVHDVKYIEEKYSISFRTGRFGTFGLAVNKYCNLPYQTWEIKPERDGTVSLQITAAILFIEFNVNGKLVCISKLQNSPTSAMKEHIGEYYKLTKLMRIMKEGGIDIFPGQDAFFYVEGIYIYI